VGAVPRRGAALADRLAPGQRPPVLIGPSGGYALSAQFLARFQRISVLEPDPLARWLLRRRFPGAAFDWQDSECLPQPGGFARLAAAFPDAAFLFCNLLGQELQGQPARFDRAGLAGRTRARPGWPFLGQLARPGFHRAAPDSHEPVRLDRAIPRDELLAQFWHGGRLEVSDHETAGLCPQAPRQYRIWHLAPRSFHLIEWLDRQRPCS